MENILNLESLMPAMLPANSSRSANGFSPAMSQSQLDPDLMKLLQKQTTNSIVDGISLMSEHGLHKAEFSNALASLTTRVGILESLQRSLG